MEPTKGKAFPLVASRCLAVMTVAVLAVATFAGGSRGFAAPAVSSSIKERAEKIGKIGAAPVVFYIKLFPGLKQALRKKKICDEQALTTLDTIVAGFDTEGRARVNIYGGGRETLACARMLSAVVARLQEVSDFDPGALQAVSVTQGYIEAVSPGAPEGFPPMKGSYAAAALAGAPDAEFLAVRYAPQSQSTITAWIKVGSKIFRYGFTISARTAEATDAWEEKWRANMKTPVMVKMFGSAYTITRTGNDLAINGTAPMF